MWFESVIDVASIAAGINSIRNWDSSTSTLDKVMDVGGLILDVGALALPVVPGGIGLIRAGGKLANKATDLAKAGDKVADGLKAADKGKDAAKTADKAKDASKAADAPCSPCFAAGTSVLTENGPRPIEEIQPGDHVWAFNLATGAKELRPVLSTSVRVSDTPVVVTVDGEEIETTAEHPFWVAEKGWAVAGTLKPGDNLLAADGEFAAVEEVQRFEGGLLVFNLEVDEAHTYYASGHELLVHNGPCDIKEPYKRPNNATTPEQRASVQDKPCVDCGKKDKVMRADHKKPLVKEYYEKGSVDQTKMRSKKAVQPQCKACSDNQGGKLSGYSKAKKKELGLE